MKRKPKRLIILVTGTPGVGKTVVSGLLAKRLKALHVDLGELVKHQKLVEGFDGERKSFIVDTSKVARHVEKMIKEREGHVVIDGHYVMEVVPPKFVSFVFVLRRKPEELKKILENRGFEGRKLWENLAAEILDVCLYDAIKACSEEKVCEIDASGKEAEDVVEEIVSVLKDKRKCRLGIVDWLGELEKESRLEEFLKYF